MAQERTSSQRTRSVALSTSESSPFDEIGPLSTSTSHSSSSPLHLTPRRTRASTRQAATSSEVAAFTPILPVASPSVRPPASARKRKAPASDSSPTADAESSRASSARRNKRQKVSEPVPPVPPAPPPPAPALRRRKEKAPTVMSSPGTSAGPSNEPLDTAATASKRKSNRNRKSGQEPSVTTPPSARRSKRPIKDAEVEMNGSDEKHEVPGDDRDGDEGSGDNEDGDAPRDYEGEEDDEDPFGGFGGPGGPPHGLSSTLRALSGMMSGVSSRLRDILTNLKQKEDASVQLIALQELSEILLVSTEDNLSGHFSPDAFVKELVSLMHAEEPAEENPEMMLLACRCLANLMEALPASIANVVYGGAVPVLCQKLLEIHFIDLAEQALSTLEKISVEYPASIVREGGLTACLTYLDFFATSTQRTAVTTAANCCRNIPEDSFSVIRDVMPILLNVLSSSDQKVVEQGSLCVSRVVESFRYHSSKLEELVSTDLLKAILRLLLPGTTNLIGPNIHTQFLRVLAFTAKASPSLSAELFKMNVVETLYQILTGVSPPSGTEDVASKLDSVVIMQALIHRPREQVIETLNVICELLPGLPRESDSIVDEVFDVTGTTESPAPPSGSRKISPNEKRIEHLEECKDKVKRFAIILFPTLTDAFSSTVNLSVRQKVLAAQLKMLSNLDTDILTEALRSVPYASFLAAILSQQDHPSLVNSALQAAELLLNRLDDIYRYQFYREGVITEIAKLANPPDQGEKDDKTVDQSTIKSDATDPTEVKPDIKTDDTIASNQDDEDEEEESSDEDNDENENEIEIDDPHDDASASPTSSRASTTSLNGERSPMPSSVLSMQQLITRRAKKFLEVHENEKNSKTMKKKAMKILTSLQSLATEIESFYLHQGPGNGIDLFTRLATYFDGDVLESVTSAELLNSEVVRVLLEVFSNPDAQVSNDARSAFLEVFMGRTVSKKSKTTTLDSLATLFSILIHKLQDLLSRSEHFEVVTVHHNTFDGNRSSAASMLAKQIRLKLVADDDSEIPRPYRNIMVSIHAIATFKALDDYLRPRISLSERPRGSRNRDGLSGALAALAAAGMSNNTYSSSSNTQPKIADRQFAAALAAHSTPPPPPSGATRSSRKAKSKTAPAATPASIPQLASSMPQEKTATRRSSRRQQTQTEPPPPPPPVQNEDDLQSALECADERQLSDDEEMEDSAALDAIVGDLDEEMENGTPPDPGAVSLEVAVGGKITARKEDGTRVATPSQMPQTGSSRSSSLYVGAASTSTATPTSSSRPLSYAAAIQSVPQDWHIEFSLDDRPIPNETTIYRAVHNSTAQSDEHMSRSVWSAIHPIKFKRVPGPPPSEPSSLTQVSESVTETAASGIPASLDKHPTTSSILRLLNILHALNANLDDVLAENKDTLKLNSEPLSQFVNTKLTAKLNRQLEEPLIVASNCLPSWSEDLARLYPFLFPFETRHLFLQSTSFGYARSMTRWQNAQSADESRRDRHRDERPFLGRLQRQKVRISRTKILESALKVMDLYGASQSILEVEYFEEVGTGLGPTLEFYSTVSKEFSKKKLKLWRETDSNDSDEYAFGASGLFPAPMSEEQAPNENGKRILHLFTMLGKFVARSMIDSRIIDVSFNSTFFRIGDGSKTVTPSLGAVKTVDSQLAASLKLIKKFALAKKGVDEDPSLGAAQKVAAAEAIRISGVRVDDLGLDFTLPGYSSIELLPNGSQIPVTIENVGLYLEKVIDMTLGSGVQRQVDAFRAGFTQVFPYSALSAFTPDELVMLFGRVEEDWSLETLMDSIKADHGFNMDSKSVKNLLQTMSELSLSERRDFLQFTTGSPKLPIGGFKSLTPMFTVVCKPSEPPYTSDDYLPSVMTCVNYLKLPDYTDLQVMKRRMNTAIKEGQGAFHLS